MKRILLIPAMVALLGVNSPIAQEEEIAKTEFWVCTHMYSDRSFEFDMHLATWVEDPTIKDARIMELITTTGEIRMFTSETARHWQCETQ